LFIRVAFPASGKLDKGFHSSCFPSEWEEFSPCQLHSDAEMFAFPFNLFSQRVGRVRLAALAQYGFQATNRRISKNLSIST